GHGSDQQQSGKRKTKEERKSESSGGRPRKGIALSESTSSKDHFDVNYLLSFSFEISHFTCHPVRQNKIDFLLHHIK
ncbi:hypothetical protein Q6264_30060, partial [Klebsiella pneumoniae]|uniref:hypothetical protein n=1 Tax=Klebsiella pneumoniae TaxID=573 RepID=UPI0027318ED8